MRLAGRHGDYIYIEVLTKYESVGQTDGQGRIGAVIALRDLRHPSNAIWSTLDG